MLFGCVNSLNYGMFAGPFRCERSRLSQNLVVATVTVEKLLLNLFNLIPKFEGSLRLYSCKYLSTYNLYPYLA